MSKAKDTDLNTDLIRLLVRTIPEHGSMRRYRAGLGPFGQEPVEVMATREQADLLRCDPVLVVTVVEG